MPHKPSNGDNNAPIYVSLNMTNDVKVQLRQWADRNVSDLWEHVKALVAEDYAFTVRADKEVGFIASLRPSEKCRNTNNKGKMLMERGSDPERAVMRLLWAHLEHFERNWPKGERQLDDDW